METRFYDSINNLLDETDIEKMYNDIVFENTYEPSTIINLLTALLYRLEHESRLDPQKLATICNYRAVLLGADKNRDHLTKLELLYVLVIINKWKLRSANSPISESSVYKNMYM